MCESTYFFFSFPFFGTAFLNKSFSVKTLYFHFHGYELSLKILLRFKNKTSKENDKIIFTLLSFSHQALSKNQFISLDEFIKNH